MSVSKLRLLSALSSSSSVAPSMLFNVLRVIVERFSLPPIEKKSVVCVCDVGHLWSVGVGKCFIRARTHLIHSPERAGQRQLLK